jgi:D-glycero-D-manno-heptose 1,7-bisphosphate phosphatase
VSPARAAFLDRDGVLCALVPDPETGLPEAPLHVDDVALVAGAAAAANRLAANGWLLVGVSNQPAAAKGKVLWSELEAVQRRVLELLRDTGVQFDGFYLCPHHPDGVVPELTGPCECRKPRPGMLLTAARELQIDLAASWMIGDTDSDVIAGAAAGCRTALIECPGSAHKRHGGSGADVLVPTLGSAVDVVLAARAERVETVPGGTRGHQ